MEINGVLPNTKWYCRAIGFFFENKGHDKICRIIKHQMLIFPKNSDNLALSL